MERLILICCSDALATHFNDPTATEAYAIYNTGLRTPLSWQYNTLVHWTVTDTGVNATRPVQKYITSNFKYQWGWSIASHPDGNIRLFAIDSGNLYVAKVAWDNITDTSQVRRNAVSKNSRRQLLSDVHHSLLTGMAHNTQNPMNQAPL